jgi:transposase
MGDRELLEQVLCIVTRQQQQLDRLERLVKGSVEKETYTVEEVAERLKRSEWTVRQWCNKGQVEGAKKVHGRGRKGEWRIPHEALLKLQSEGPLPVTKAS